LSLNRSTSVSTKLPFVRSSKKRHLGIAGRLNDSYASALERYFWPATICAPLQPPCKCSPVARLRHRDCRLHQEPSLDSIVEAVRASGLWRTRRMQPDTRRQFETFLTLSDSHVLWLGSLALLSGQQALRLQWALLRWSRQLLRLTLSRLSYVLLKQSRLRRYLRPV